MKEPYIKKLRVPTYKAALWIVVHPSLAKSIEYVEDLISTHVLKPSERRVLRALAFGYEDDHGVRKFILFLRPSVKAGELAHECKHLVNNIFRWYGTNLSITNDEHECYYLEDIVDKATLSLKRFKDKKKSKVILASNELIV